MAERPRIPMHEFDPMAIDIQQFRAIKASVGFTSLGQWQQALRDQDFDAIAAAVWCLQRRADPQLRYSDVHFTFDDIDWTDPDAPEDEPGKAPTSTTDGSPPSPTTTGGPGTSTTA